MTLNPAIAALKRMTFKKSLTLLELMIGLVLIALVSGVVGVRIGGAMEEKRFRSSVDRLFAELESCRRQALAAQVDWVALLEKKKDIFILRKVCPETGKEVASTWKSACEMSFNGKAANALSFQFASSGKVAPSGTLILSDKKRTVSWKLPDQFSVVED